MTIALLHEKLGRQLEAVATKVSHFFAQKSKSSEEQST
jgi:hypothetical protein